MVFSSLFFLFFFLPINLVLYYAVGSRKIQNLILVFFSLLFYAWGEPIWVSLLIFSALVDYLNALWIERYRSQPHIARWGVVSSLLINLSLLLAFKYTDFILENVNFLFGSAFSQPHWALPIGISFYTFQTISYTIDVYRNEVKAQKSFLDFLLYVSLYPQLVAGPIVRYQDIAEEIENRKFDKNDFSSGVTRFCKGLFKKVFLANIAGELAKGFLDADPATFTVAGSALGLLLFSLQIFFDFAGYSDMAIGLGRMFGFHYHENFNYPYIAQSITDFWRRWHISLSSFFRDYVYIPLGGNRKYAVRNLFIVWALTGLWHGASWNFMLWGLYFGVLLFFEKLFFQKILSQIPVFFRHAYALFFIWIAWGIFYFEKWDKLVFFFQTLFFQNSAALTNEQVSRTLLENLFWFVAAFALCTPIYPKLESLFEKYLPNLALRQAVFVLVNIFLFFVSITLLVGNSYNPFLYFRF